MVFVAVLFLWLAASVLVVALCVAAKRGDRALLIVPRPVDAPDWVATVMMPASTVAPPLVAPRSPSMN